MRAIRFGWNGMEKVSDVEEKKNITVKGRMASFALNVEGK